MAEFVTVSADLVYDIHRPLILDYAHILGDNISRFPVALQNHPSRARAALDAAKDLTLKRLRRNYKLAIPQWYPRLKGEGAQLLLPLDLTNSGTADLALVIAAIGDRYRGSTVLTLEMAYTNARLVARPDSQWLKPLSEPLEGLLDPTSPSVGMKREREPSLDDGRGKPNGKPVSPQAQTSVYARR